MRLSETYAIYDSNGKLEDRMKTLGVTVQHHTTCASGNPDVVVAYSGGRDSQACLILAIESCGEDRVHILFNDTKYEHKLTYAHIAATVAKYPKCGFTSLNAGSVEEICIKKGRFPSGTARHCTRELKIIPSKKFYACYGHDVGGFEVWIGIRGDEGSERSKKYGGMSTEVMPLSAISPSLYPKYLEDRYSVLARLPLLESNLDDVKRIVGDGANPLYEKFDSCGCFPCLAAGDGYKAACFGHDDQGADNYDIAVRIAIATGKKIFNSKGLDNLNSGCWFCRI